MDWKITSLCLQFEPGLLVPHTEGDTPQKWIYNGNHFVASRKKVIKTSRYVSQSDRDIYRCKLRSRGLEEENKSRDSAEKFTSSRAMDPGGWCNIRIQKPKESREIWRVNYHHAHGFLLTVH
jgi:hypothetical protein